MKYNIDFEIAAAIFLVLFYFFHKIQFYTNTKGSRLFQKIIISLLVACITDFATALSISYAHDIPVWVNVLLNTIYFEVAPFSTYLVILYFEAVLESDKDVQDQYWIQCSILMRTEYISMDPYMSFCMLYQCCIH